jgi:DNA repair exonuclease SbcCD nuclease subunit
VTLALERRVAIVLFAGDVFDSEDRTLASQLDFREQLRRLAAGGIASYLVHGNHDPLSGWEARLDLPVSVHRFGPKVTSVPFLRDGRVVARIYGFSYPRRDVTRNVVEEFRAAAQEPESAGEGVFRIGLLHSNVGGGAGRENYAPCSLDDLCAAGMDYWALGHVHEREILREREPFVAYPGTFQSRRRGETGPRGCFAVTLTPGSRHVQCEFVPVDAVRRYRHTLDLSSMETEERLLGALSELKESIRADAEGRMALLQVASRGGPRCTERFSARISARNLRCIATPVRWSGTIASGFFLRRIEPLPASRWRSCAGAIISWGTCCALWKTCVPARMSPCSRVSFPRTRNPGDGSARNPEQPHSLSPGVREIIGSSERCFWTDCFGGGLSMRFHPLLRLRFRHSPR